MCGFCGIYGKSNFINEKSIKKMTNVLSHRGPDDAGYYVDEEIALGHRRLSIIDLSDSGKQPISNETGDIITVFNGEIYNYKSLKDGLVSKGYKFKGTSDSEVIPHLYQRDGISFVEKLNGMFSIAIYDRNKKSLFLMRDRYGIKPLYYYIDNDFISFASEIKSLFQLPNIKKRINYQSIHDFLSLHYMPKKNSAFKDIFEVNPGQIIKWENGIKKEQSFWSFNHILENKKIFKKSLIEELPKRFDKAVISQSVSDVPISVLISGGIDSSLVAESLHREGGFKNLLGYTIKFNDEKFDESEYAKIVAKRLSIKHEIKNIEDSDLTIDLLEKTISHFDEPFADSSLIPMYLVSKEISKKRKVAFSGDGGDEIFGGYDRFVRIPQIFKLRFMPKNISRLLISLIKPFYTTNDFLRTVSKGLNLSRLELNEILFSVSSYMSEEQKNDLYSSRDKLLLSSSRLYSDHNLDVRTTDDLSKLITYYLMTISLPGDMLKKVDMMSMMNGLEVRVPMLDNGLVENYLGLPHNYKVQNSKAKILLRGLARKRISKNIADKKKWGFAIPIDKLINKEIIDYLFDLLLSPNSFSKNYFNKSLIEQWIHGLKNNSSLKLGLSRVGLYQRIIMLLSIELWIKKFNPET